MGPVMGPNRPKDMGSDLVAPAYPVYPLGPVEDNSPDQQPGDHWAMLLPL